MRSLRVRLEDVAEAIDGIENLLSGADLASFTQSWPMKRAVERGLEIISEASRAIPETYRDARPDVPWTQIAAIGNILRHEYHRVEPAIIPTLEKIDLWLIPNPLIPAKAGM